MASAVEVLTSEDTFEHFIVGPSNRMAYAAALTVAQGSARSYSPVYIYGGPGLGKTHLLHAVAHYVVEHRAGLSVRYVAGERLAEDLINAVRDSTLQQLVQHYSTTDFLLIDDLHLLERQWRPRNEFCLLLDRAFRAGRQIVLAADRFPWAIEHVKEWTSLTPRWGLVTDLEAPDHETRMAILRAYAERRGWEIRDTDLLPFIAGQVEGGDVREMKATLAEMVRPYRFQSFSETESPI